MVGRRRIIHELVRKIFISCDSWAEKLVMRKASFLKPWLLQNSKSEGSKTEKNCSCLKMRHKTSTYAWAEFERTGVSQTWMWGWEWWVIYFRQRESQPCDSHNFNGKKEIYFKSNDSPCAGFFLSSNLGNRIEFSGECSSLTVILSYLLSLGNVSILAAI